MQTISGISISEITKNYEQIITKRAPSKIRSQNDSYVDAFVTAINRQRHTENNIARERMKLDPQLKLTIWKPVSPRAIAVRLATCCPEDIDKHFLLKKCQQATNFSQCFFGLTKHK